MMIGGGGEKYTLRVTAEQADWWNLGGSLENYEHKLNVLRGHCEAVGRDYDSIVKTWAGDRMVVAENAADAQKIIDNAPMKPDVSPEDCTPEGIAAQLQQYIDLGVQYFILRFADFPNTAGVELFADKVIPQLR